ncbi:MAG TPA: 3D domain-containing protein [Candidatus Binatia bacterium]|nr:3D domain-containing protein [Candidatus Binatia bacterium]
MTEKDIDWGTAVVVDPRELQRLRTDVDRLRRKGRRRAVAACAFTATTLVAALYGYRTTAALATTGEEMAECRATVEPTQTALTALARSHESMLSATQEAPSMGTKSWGRRFTVTMYVPMHPDYGATNDGLTATMTKADPKSRIVAVDPKLIPYGSWVWVEELGWFRAEDCGGAIKGFRLDLLTATEKEAFQFGKQDRFVIVVPPADA